MELKEYANLAAKTNAILGDKLQNNLHMILGLVTEVGELADAFKKYIAYGKEIDWVNVQEEVGDVMWYLINLCTLNGFDLEKILERNIAKLKARYPNEFEVDRALNRDLQREREILEDLGWKEEKSTIYKSDGNPIELIKS
jgi:NTP pyrophosphatase (non-canonical NTP hydrolase)